MEWLAGTEWIDGMAGWMEWYGYTDVIDKWIE